METIIAVNRKNSNEHTIQNFLSKLSNMRNINVYLDSSLFGKRAHKYHLVFSFLDSYTIKVQAKSLNEIQAIRSYLSKSTKKVYKIKQVSLTCEDNGSELGYRIIKELRRKLCLL